MSVGDERAFLRALGACIQVLRADQRVSQEQFATMIGVSRAYVGELERGEHATNIVVLWRIAEALRAPLAVLVDEATNPSPPVPLVSILERRAGLGGGGG